MHVFKTLKLKKNTAGEKYLKISTKGLVVLTEVTQI